MSKDPLARTYASTLRHSNKVIILFLFVGRDGLSGRDGVKVSNRKNMRYKPQARNSTWT